MTNDQKIRLRLSQVRGRLNDIAGIEDLTDEIRSEAEALHTELNDLSIRERALIPSEGITETRDTGLDAEARERLELRSKASLTAYIRAALSGRQVDGPEAELRSAAKIGDGIPLELWSTADPATETRQDASTPAPGAAVNLDRIRPAVFAASIAPMLGYRDAARRVRGLRIGDDFDVTLGWLASEGRQDDGDGRRVHRDVRHAEANQCSTRDPR